MDEVEKFLKKLGEVSAKQMAYLEGDYKPELAPLLSDGDKLAMLGNIIEFVKAKIEEDKAESLRRISNKLDLIFKALTHMR